MGPRNIPSELRDLGLTDREAKVCMALLKGGKATATQLAVATRIPQNKIYRSWRIPKTRSSVSRVGPTPTRAGKIWPPSSIRARNRSPVAGPVGLMR